jgi:hypothetical protein
MDFFMEYDPRYVIIVIQAQMIVGYLSKLNHLNRIFLSIVSTLKLCIESEELLSIGGQVAKKMKLEAYRPAAHTGDIRVC